MIEVSTRAPAVVLNHQPMPATQVRPGEGASVDGDGLSIMELEKFLLDIRDEPEWRSQANRCADYYDHNQLTDEVRAEFARLGLPPLIINLIHPTINTVLGMEAKTRTDWKVDFEDEANEPVAQAIGKKMTEAERMSSADRAISNAYAAQVKAGLHWVEVGWNSNPFGYRYRVRDVHRREIWWDWRKREVEDWRYLVRKQRFDRDHLAFAFPNMRDMIDSAVEGGTTWQEYAHRMDDRTGLGQFVDIERAMTFDDQDWVDCHRKQLLVFEVWYQQWTRGYVARVGDTVIEVDQKNPRHMLAIAYKKMTPTLATYPKLRQALFLGPQRVFDRPTPLPHRKIPYVPFFGYREDLTGAPYGLIRGMLSSQDEINARRSKALALLNSRRGQADSDALDLNYNTHEDVADEISRHNSYVVLNPTRKNGANAFKVEDNADLAQGQTTILQESKDEIHQTSGVFPPMAGDQRGGLSGVAVNQLVEQGTQTLAEINDNYSWGRREVGEQVMELVKHDSTYEHTVKVGEGKQKKDIALNARNWDNNLGEVVENNVATAQLKLVLEDVPSTPAWRQQQSQALAEITKSLPPQLQAFVVPFYMEATDLKDRKEIASLLRKQMGIPERGADGQEAEDPRLAQLQQERDQVVSELSGQLQEALKELQSAKADQAGKEADREVKRLEITKRAEVDNAKIGSDRMKALQDSHAKRLDARRASLAGEGAGADPQSLVKAVRDEIEPAIDEMIDTMRELATEMDDRFKKMEGGARGSNGGSDKPGDDAGGDSQPPLQVVVQGVQLPAKPQKKTVRMKTPLGDIVATLDVDGTVNVSTPQGEVKGKVEKGAKAEKPGEKPAAGE